MSKGSWCSSASLKISAIAGAIRSAVLFSRSRDGNQHSVGPACDSGCSLNKLEEMQWNANIGCR